MDSPDDTNTNHFLDINDLKLELNHGRDLHNIFFANIRSLRKNFDDLLEILENIENKFTFIILNETWIDDNEQDLFKIDGYDIYIVYQEIGTAVEYSYTVVTYLKPQLLKLYHLYLQHLKVCLSKSLLDRIHLLSARCTDLLVIPFQLVIF